MDAKNTNVKPWPKQGLSEHVRAAPAPIEPRPSREQAEAAVRTLIAYAGDNPDREGLLETPKRVIGAYEEIYQGYSECPVEVLDRTFSETGGYDDFVQWTRQRYLTYTQLAIAQHVPVQIAIARIAAQIDAAELLARRALSTARQDYAGMPMETRTLLRRDFTYAMQTLRDAMDALIKVSGSSGLMDDNSVQRCWRDVHAISSHVVMNWDVPAENFGRNEFGLGLNPAYQMF